MRNIIFLIILFPSLLFSETQQIKISVLAPEGTTWMTSMRAWSKELKEKTNGKLEFKIYGGGVSGDEFDVIRKMRAGQIHAGGFTGVGLGQILSEIRVLELPFLFKNYKEVDHVTASMKTHFEQEFEKKGFIFLGFGEAGFVNIYSAKPLKSQADLKASKMWAWEGDELVKTLCQTYGIVPVSLAITDVMTSLQTGLINSFYAPPLGAIALQWFTKVKYMTRPELTNSIGATVMTKKFYDKIPSENQKILKEVSDKYSKKVIEGIRTENEKAYETLKKNGIQFVTIPNDELTKMQETSKKVQKALVGKLYPQKTLDQVTSLLEEYRKKNK